MKRRQRLAAASRHAAARQRPFAVRRSHGAFWAADGRSCCKPSQPRADGRHKLKVLDLSGTQVTDAGCAALAAELDSGALPALGCLYLAGTPASAAAKAAVGRALVNVVDPPW